VIEITVRLFATLRAYHPAMADPSSGQGFVLALQQGTNLRDLLETCLGIPRDTVKMMFVNGIARDDTYVLQDSDEVGVFPPIAGGQSETQGRLS
jgi:sulfur-carrier protein